MMNTTLRKYYLPLFFILTSFLSTQQVSYPTPTDTLNTSQIFRDNSTSTFISSGGTFELGFFSPNNSNDRYLGMWYKKIPVRTIVWVANRDNPADDLSSALKFIEPGILALLNSNGNTIWSTNTSTTVQNPVAQLLDSGNLVVKDANDDNPKNFAWQSFEHPTDTFFPGMKLDSTDSRVRRPRILTLIFALVSGILLLSLSMILYSRKRKKLNHPHRKIGKTRQNNVNNHGVSHNEELELPLFELSTISKATNNFLINNKLGEGGFGPVYKGVLQDGQEIAVKRLSRTSNQGVDEFKNEVVCIAKLQHRNLVKLLGWCFQSDEMMLVYEYMTNKSLDIILFDSTKSMLLDWPSRFNIITSIARGLMYLHQDSRLRVIHRDLKASNILLDSDLNPKISDFGLARILGGNETGDNTRRVVGTYGYMSPEYATHGLFSVKSDVYSFGVLVLEIITGKRNRLFSHNDHHLDLLGHAWMLYREERSSELVDSCLRNSCNLSEVVRSIHIGLLCVQERPEDRPSMSSVVQMLGSDNVLPEPKYPGFFTGIDKQNETPSNNIVCSSNSISITLEAR